MQAQKKYNYQQDVAYLQQINEIIKESYAVSGKHLEGDISKCDELYYFQQDNNLLAFFMVHYHEIDNTLCCYLGLSACRSEYKNMGLVGKLYGAFKNECQKRQLMYGKRILCYWTTVTPIVYHWFCKNLNNVVPDLAGNITEEGKRLGNIIAQSQYCNAKFSSDNPFLLRKAVKETRYLPQEKEKIKEALTKLEIAAFDRYKLDESEGDRFLMIGYC